MPQISQFYGIIISMFYKEHGIPHFHAEYGEDEAVIAIGSGDILEGDLPRRRLHMVRQWRNLHRDELLVNWDRARQRLPLNNIDPLP